MDTSVRLLQIVIYSGIGLSVVPAITLLFFDDDKALREEEVDPLLPEATPAKEDDAAGAHLQAARAMLDNEIMLLTAVLVHHRPRKAHRVLISNVCSDGGNSTLIIKPAYFQQGPDGMANADQSSANASQASWRMWRHLWGALLLQGRRRDG